MKEIFVDVYKELKIANSYKNKLVISRTEDGYFVESDNQKLGPYLKVFTDTSETFNYDVFVFGCKADMIEVYRNGIYGLESTQEMDITNQLAKTMQSVYGKKNIERMVAPEFEGCTYLGEAFVYKLSKGGDFAHLDGMQRTRVPNLFRYVYQTAEGQFFVVNPKAELLPLEKYRKFDSFAELNMARRQKDGVEYDNIKCDRSIFASPISSIVKKMRNYGLSDEQIQPILDELKSVIGVCTYRRAKNEDVKLSSRLNMKLVDLNEIREVLTTTKPIGFYYRSWRDYSNPWMKRVAKESELKGVVANMGYQLKTEGALLDVNDKSILIDYNERKIIEVGKDLFNWAGKTTKQGGHSIVYSEVDVLRMKRPEIYDEFMDIIQKRNEEKFAREEREKEEREKQ